MSRPRIVASTRAALPSGRSPMTSASSTARSFYSSLVQPPGRRLGERSATPRWDSLQAGRSPCQAGNGRVTAATPGKSIGVIPKSARRGLLGVQPGLLGHDEPPDMLPESRDVALELPPVDRGKYPDPAPGRPLDHPAMLREDVPRSADGDGDEWHLPLDGHPEGPVLERL